MTMPTNVWARDATPSALALASYEDSLLYDSIIHGHHIFKEIWTPHTFKPVVEVKVRVHRTPHLLSACANKR